MFVTFIVPLTRKKKRSIASACCSSCKEEVELAPYSNQCFRCIAEIGQVVSPPRQPAEGSRPSCLFCWLCSSQGKSGEGHCCICNAWHCVECLQLNSQQIQDPFREPLVCTAHRFVFSCPICQKNVAATRPCARCKSRFVCSSCCKIGNGGYLCVLPDAENGGVAHFSSCDWCKVCDSFQMENFSFYCDDSSSRSIFRLCRKHISIFKAIYDALRSHFCADILTLIGNWLININSTTA